MSDLLQQASPLALGILAACLIFGSAMLLAWIADKLFNISETEEDKKDDA